MFDPNMDIALSVSRGLAQGLLELPAPLVDVQSRARFIHDIDRPFLIDGNGEAQWIEFGSHLRVIAQLSSSVMPDIASELDRVSVALALWAGCIMAAKGVAFETRAGENTVTGRGEVFERIDRLAAQDALFCAGVEAAPAFKTQRQQDYSLEGVPDNSPVRRFVHSMES
jgi:hypothetical protein